MRCRNPWFLARFRLLGWNVRFTKRPLWKNGGGTARQTRRRDPRLHERVEGRSPWRQPARETLAPGRLPGGTVPPPAAVRTVAGEAVATFFHSCGSRCGYLGRQGGRGAGG